MYLTRRSRINASDHFTIDILYFVLVYLFIYLFIVDLSNPYLDID